MLNYQTLIRRMRKKFILILILGFFLGWCGCELWNMFQTWEATRTPVQLGGVKTFIEGGFTHVQVENYDWTERYYLLRYGKDFGALSLFGQASRDELGKLYGFGLRLNLGDFYVFHCQGQGMDNVDRVNRKWVYTYPEELVTQHSYVGNGIGYCYIWDSWGLFIEYSKDRIECGDHRGGSWNYKADKINLGLRYNW